MSRSLTRQDLLLIAKLLLIIWLGLMFVVLLREIAGSLTIRDWDYSASNDLRQLTTHIWFPWVLMSPLLVLAIKRFLFLPGQMQKNLLIHLFLLTAFTVAHLGAVAFHFQYFVEDKSEAMRVYAGWQHMGHFLVSDPFILTDLVIYLLFVASFNISRYIELVLQKEQVASRLETHLAESKLRALQMQVNPHFLFNTLNSITALMRKGDVESAEEMILRLSDFFRMTLERNVSQIVPLEVELELVDNYLAIEQQRFKDRLEVKHDIDRDSLAVSVPALILQPLVENSIKHGIAALNSPGVIELRSRYLGDRVLLEVIDNGKGANLSEIGENERGIGLNNVRERIEQLYGKAGLFTLHSEPGKGMRVSLEIPVSHAVVDQSVSTASSGPPVSAKLLSPGSA